MKAYCVLVLLMGGGQVFGQGNLNPPGPPGPTMKTLDQIEPRTPISSVPYTITSPGSYYLTGNFTNTGATNGITIRADNVTLDLGGFTLAGVGQFHAGIALGPRQVNVTIMNGVIRNCGAQGIEASGLRGGIVRDMHLIANSSGMQVGAIVGAGSGLESASVVERCTAVSNTIAGILVGIGCQVRSCAANYSGAYGIQAFEGSTVVDSSASYCPNGFVGRNCGFVNCSAYGNTSRGFEVSQGSKLANCVADNNGIIGISGSGEINVTGCTTSGNGDCGIALFKAFGNEASSLVKDCVMARNANLGLLSNGRVTVSGSTADHNGNGGMQLFEQASVIGCTLASNRLFGISVSGAALVQDCLAVRNGANGIAGDAGVRVIGCHAFGNGGDGINVRVGSTVKGCTVRGNGDDGIEVNSDCFVSDNHATGNGLNAGTAGAGIHATLTGNRIEGNHAVLNDNGYRVDAGPSTIFRNSARGNTTNWVIAAGNDLGPIGGATNAVSPFANIEF